MGNHGEALHDPGARRADRELAHRLGRPEPTAPEAGEGYLRRLAARPAPSEADERELVLRARGGDPDARERLVETFLPLIASVARVYRSSPTVHRLELVQEGVVGLLQALERYDPAGGAPFWGYASWWVRRAMQQLVSELTRPAVLSDRALRHLARLQDARRDAVRESGREPGREELVARSGLNAEQVDDLLAMDRAPRSLDEQLEAEDGALGTLADTLDDPAAQRTFERVIVDATAGELIGLLSELSERERSILRARYGIGGEEESLRQIGARLGLSAERVRQVEERALAKLAAAAGAR